MKALFAKITAGAALAAALLMTGAATACAPETRHRVLSFFFDGVPPLEDGDREQDAEAYATAARRRYGEHGPYAARLCDACHVQGSNSLVLPQEELCLNCHPLRLDRAMLHGPLASGSCVICHAPHGSAHRYLLVSDSKEFCLYCHDKNQILKREAHQGVDAECTTCHDAHGSGRQFLLK